MLTPNTNKVNYTITEGTKDGAIEVYFAEKPDAETREALKALKMRWNGSKGCWWGFTTAEAINAAIMGENSPTAAPVAPAKAKKPAKLAPLWERVQLDTIPEHNRRLDTKTIAAETRKHLRRLFPECKFSVTCDYNSIRAYIKSAPYGKEKKLVWDNWSGCEELREVPGEALQAVLDYCEAWLQSFNYDNSDYMTDYYDVNFYGDFKLDYNFTVTEATPEILADTEAFKAAKAAHEAAEEERRMVEAEREAVEMEERRIAAEKAERENLAALAEIEARAEVVDLDENARYMLTDLIGGHGKENTLEEVKESAATNTRRESAEISREIYLSSEDWAKLSAMLMYDSPIWAGFGGTGTFDERVTDEDYYRLTTEQRAAVVWYIANAVAVYVDGKLAAVIDPQGYNYARYVHIPTEDTHEQPRAEFEAETNGADLPAFYFPKAVQTQAESVKPGDVLTLVSLDGWTLETRAKHITVTNCTPCSYAQYKNAVLLEYIEDGKRKPETMYIHANTSAALFPGRLEALPDEVLYTPISDTMRRVNFAGDIDFIKTAIRYYIGRGYSHKLCTVAY